MARPPLSTFVIPQQQSVSPETAPLDAAPASPEPQVGVPTRPPLSSFVTGGTNPANYPSEDPLQVSPTTGSGAIPQGTADLGTTTSQDPSYLQSIGNAMGKQADISTKLLGQAVAGYGDQGQPLSPSERFAAAGAGAGTVAISPLSVAGAGVGAALAPVVNWASEKLGHAVDFLTGQPDDTTAKAVGNAIQSIAHLIPSPVQDVLGTALNTAIAIPSGAVASAVGEAIGKGAAATGEAIGTGAKAVGETAGDVTKFGVGQATGLAPETISTIKNLPEEFGAAQDASLSRVDLGQQVKQGIDQRLSALSDTGGLYQDIRSSGSEVTLPNNWFQQQLQDAGMTVEDGKITATSSSMIRNPADINALQKVYDLYGDTNTYDANQVLNLRQDLSDLAKYGEGTTNAATSLGKDMRSFVDSEAKQQIPGLADLDAQYAPERQLLGQIKKDYIDPSTGGLKDGALNKIANLTGAGKDQILSRLEEVSPGITQQINIVKALEDIEKASGQKVGTYARAAVGGALGFSGGPLGAIIGAAATSPAVVVPIIRSYGLATKAAGDFIDRVIAKMQNGLKLTSKESKLVSDALEPKSTGLKPLPSEGQNISSADKTPEVKTEQSIKDKQATQDLGKSEAGAAGGNTMTLYTGGPKGISDFKLPEGDNIDSLMYGKGIYLTPDQSLATGYAGDTGQVYKTEVSINNPLTPKSKDWQSFMGQGSSQAKLNWLQKKGYDSVVDTTGKYKQVMVTDPSQIKIIKPAVKSKSS